MDLLSLPARFLARPAAAALGIEGSTPHERAANLRAEIEQEPEDELALGERHLGRAALWLTTAAVLFPLAILVSWLIEGSIVLPVLWTVALGTVAMFLLHVIKALLAYYVIGSRWNPRSRPWRIAMLSQWPDVAIALAAAVAAQFLL
ncbi:hypothetical protein [Actinoplanes sp. NPDC023714]|uniref:hypothetical protein n=1 Tax=Actinoplanes sp. NPDC023714 TaxID=3154322 RepID=UPI0033FDF9CB